MSLRPAIRMAGTPYPEVTGLICRVPSPEITPSRLRLFTQGHLCRFLVRSRSWPQAFFTGTRNKPKPAFAGPITPSPGSHRYDTPPGSMLEQRGIIVRPVPMLGH